jgi:pimeloyl-ACP methyl ester carboxylesterase
MHARSIRIHGCEMVYRLSGNGPLLVLIHGMAGSGATWRHVIPTLSKRFTVLAPDLLGHGESAKPKGDYSLGAHATMVRDLMTALHLDRATLVGQSFGGGVAMQLAYQYPDKCERLVLVGSGGLGESVNLLLRALAMPGGASLLPIGCRPLFHKVGAKVASWLASRGKTPGPALVEIGHAYASLTDAATRDAFVQTLRGVVDGGGQRVSARDKLYLTADVPTLIVWGDADPIIPISHAHDAHAAMPGSRLVVYPGVGHYPHCEEPAAFADELMAFVDDTQPASLSGSRIRELLVRGAAELPLPEGTLCTDVHDARGQRLYGVRVRFAGAPPPEQLIPGLLASGFRCSGGASGPRAPCRRPGVAASGGAAA